MTKTPVHLFVLGVLILAIAACGDTSGETSPAQSPGENTETVSQGTPEPAQSVSRDEPIYAHHATENLPDVFEPWKGDLPAMVERRLIRALVPWSDTYYYLDGAQQKGISYEVLKMLEKWINEQVDSGPVKMHIVILPVRRDQLIDFVAAGRGDIAMGGITITEERSKMVDFTEPTSKSINEVVVESPTAEPLENLDDLAGREVHVRRASSYWESLEVLNRDFEKRGLPPIQLVPADEHFSTEDLIQMANSSAIDYTVADGEIAGFWTNVLADARIRKDLVVREGVHYGWVLRKDSPEFKELINRFVADNRQGTLTGNIIINRYLKDSSRLHAIHGDEERQRFNEVIQYFEQFAPEHDFETLMMVAQGFQESRLDQSRRSHRGAIGVMQLLPSTAADSAVGIDDITTAENNILAGIRYMAWIKKTFFDDPDLDGFNRTAMAFASYNAGPSRVRDLRKKAGARGLDPDVWFDNVELIAAEEIGRETVDYVANIYKYYLAFSLSEQMQAETGRGPPDS